MDEKTMVNDILAGVKASLNSYQTAIAETENMQLRQTLQQIRNITENGERKEPVVLNTGNDLKLIANRDKFYYNEVIGELLSILIILLNFM